MNLYLWVFLISMVPIVELRGALPVAILNGLPFWQSYLLCVLGNMLPVFALLLIAPWLINLAKKIPKIGPFFARVQNKAASKAEEISAYEFWGLLLFVGIPLPGTGAWTGSLVASFLGMKYWKGLLAIFLGVLLSGMIMAVTSLSIHSLF